jgi:hypothetical protein
MGEGWGEGEDESFPLPFTLLNKRAFWVSMFYLEPLNKFKNCTLNSPYLTG